MAEITREMLYDCLVRTHHRLKEVQVGLGDVRREMTAMRGTAVAMQQDIHNIYGILGRHNERLDRIERRLDLRELAEPQKPFDFES